VRADHDAAAPESVPAGPSKRRILALALLIPASGTLPVFLTGGLAVQIQADLGFGASELGIAVAVFFGASALCSTPAGRFVHRVGPARSMLAGGATAITALLGVATVAGSLPLLIAFLAVGGLANAICQPGVNDLLARGIRIGRQGFAFAVKQCAIPFSALLGGLAVPLVALTVGWRWAFAAGAVLAVTAVALVPRASATGSAADERPAGGRRLAVRPLVLLAIAGGFGSGAGGAIGSFLVASSVEVGIAERTAGLLLAGASVLILATRLLMGHLADRRGSGFFGMVAVMLAAGAAGFALLAATSVPVFIAGALVASIAGWGWPGLFQFAIVDNDRGIAALATGITQTGVYTGGVAGPLVFGWLAEHLSYSTAWLTTAASALIAATMVVVGSRSLRRRNPAGS
jgi:MFS family permease